MEPKWFSWRGRHLKITKTTHVWPEQDGKDVIHKFVLTDGNDLHELLYRQGKLLWLLEAVETDG